MSDVDVILLLLGPPASPSSMDVMQLSASSIEKGLYVRISTNPLELARVRSADRATVVIVSEYRESDYDVFALISILRCVRNVGVILLTDHHMDSHRPALRAGAHACLPSGVALETFCATVHHVASQYAPAGETHACASDVWRLVSKGWELNTPDGRTIELTATERFILSRLFEAKRETVGYADLLAQHGYEGAQMRSIPLLAGAISRLRRKCERMGVVLPLQAFRNKGYRFAADAVVG